MKNTYKQASLTVEATLVMLIVLAVICFIIYESLFMYDRCIMKGAAYEGAVMSSNQEHMKERVDTGIVIQEIRTRAGTAFYGSPAYNVDKKNGTWTVTASASRSLESSSILKMVLENSSFTLEMNSRCYSPKRERIIRSTNAVIKLKDKDNGHGN